MTLLSLLNTVPVETVPLRHPHFPLKQTVYELCSEPFDTRQECVSKKMEIFVDVTRHFSLRLHRIRVSSKQGSTFKIAESRRRKEAYI